MNKGTFILFLLLSFAFFSCGGPGTSEKASALDRRDQIRLKQYMIQGKRLYGIHCGNCHQPNGEGLGRLYPPLQSSDYLRAAELSEIICQMKYGKAGEMLVNGVVYNQQMPGNDALTNIEIAEITTYIYNHFIDSLVIVNQHDVAKIIAACGDSGIKKWD